MKVICIGLMIIGSFLKVQAQYVDANLLNGEFGIAVGAAHYFGDLNTRAQVNRPKAAFSALFRKQFGSYIALRVQATYAQMGYSDVYNQNEAQRIRNLSFNTDIFELAVMGDFNFYRFLPGLEELRFTPYVTMGMGIFNYDPYAYLNNERYYLRPLGTEGQTSTQFSDRKPYSTMAFCLPVGVGLKYNISPRTNITLEITHRFTATDYLDDVSTSYAGVDVFAPLPNGNPSPAMLLQDRSYETSAIPIGVKGRQRGISQKKDQFITAMFGVTFNLMSYRCPTSK